MNKDFSKVMVASITSQIVEGLLNGFKLLLSVVEKVLSLIVTIVDGHAVVISFSNTDVCEFNLIMLMFMALWSAAEWLDEKHEWDTNNCEEQKDNGDRVHGLLLVNTWWIDLVEWLSFHFHDSANKESILSWARWYTSTEDSGNHDVDNRWDESIVEISLVFRYSTD